VDRKSSSSFQKLKIILSVTPILTYPDFDQPLKVNTDASHEGIGAVLSQEINGMEKVIQFASRTLRPAEKKWCVREKEASAIIYACETFRPYLYGTKFIVGTDHHSLQWLMKVTTPARLVRSALRLAEYDFDIKYKRGENNTNVDAFSRLPKVGRDFDCSNWPEDPIKVFNIYAYQRQDPELEGIRGYITIRR
jgi:hypothetical protein